MTFQQLLYATEVGRTGSVAGASKNLFVSSSSISISIGNLEKELGYSLFSRSAKGLIPTEKGKKVLDYAERICQIHDKINSIDQEPSRTIRINSSGSSVVVDSIAQVIAEYRDRKGLRFETTAYTADDVYRKLVSGELDASLPCILQQSLGYWEPKFEKGDLHRQVLKTVPAAIRVGPGHPLYEAQRLHPHDLKGLTMVDNPHNPLSSGSIFSAMLYTKPENILYAAHPSMHNSLIEQGLCFGFTILPPMEKRNQSTIRYIPLEGINYHALAVTNTHHPTPPEVLRVLQVLKKNLDAAYPEEK